MRLNFPRLKVVCMKICSKLLMLAMVSLGFYVPFARASSVEDKRLIFKDEEIEQKISGCYVCRKPYVTDVATGRLNEKSMIFHSDGTVTQYDANNYDLWGTQGSGQLGLKFQQPSIGVWQVLRSDAQTAKVRAVFIQYRSQDDYPPQATGMPPFLQTGGQSVIARECVEYVFSHLQSGKFHKCVILRGVTITMAPTAYNPLSKKLPQGTPFRGSASGHLPVLWRLNVEKEWFNEFPK